MAVRQNRGKLKTSFHDIVGIDRMKANLQESQCYIITCYIGHYNNCYKSFKTKKMHMNLSFRLKCQSKMCENVHCC